VPNIADFLSFEEAAFLLDHGNWYGGYWLFRQNPEWRLRGWNTGK